MRFPQELEVMEIDLVNLHAALRTGSPSHLRIVDVVERLLRTLEQSDGSAEAGRSEIFRPVGLLPVGAGRRFADQPPLRCLLVLLELFRQTHPADRAQALAVIIHTPEPPPLAMLQNPGIEDGEQTDLLALG